MINITMINSPISITGKKGAVNFNWNEDEKHSKCICGHEWVPTHITDYICSECNKGS